MMEFDKIKHVSGYIAKDYSRDLLRLLYLYKDVSASESPRKLRSLKKSAPISDIQERVIS